MDCEERESCARPPRQDGDFQPSAGSWIRRQAVASSSPGQTAGAGWAFPGLTRSACGGRHEHPINTSTEIRPFSVEIAQEQIDHLRRRIEATRWPTSELVKDASQGIQLAFLQELARSWAEDYDFGRLAERLNALPQYTTEIDGLDTTTRLRAAPHETDQLRRPSCGLDLSAGPWRRLGQRWQVRRQRAIAPAAHRMNSSSVRGSSATLLSAAVL